MCYSTVGWVPPACTPHHPPPPHHDYTHMSHIKPVLSRTLAFVEVLCSDHMRPWLALLLSPRRWLRREDSAPSPSWIQSYLCALSVPLGLLIRKNPPLAWSPFSSRLPGSFYRLGEPACSRGPWSSYCTAYAQTRTRLVWRRAHHAFARRLLCEHPLPSSLPSSLPLIQQLPAGLIHTESPEYCWPGGRATSPKRSMVEFEIQWTQYHHHGSQKSRKDIVSAYVNKLVKH